MVCDSHQAEDVTQTVFVALAQDARQVARHPVLSGWLHRTARNLAANAVRTNVRRQTREQEAFAMNELLANGTTDSWEQIAPQLDTALGELSEPDRDVILLRFFEHKSAQEMAQTLGISVEAAQKRVNRAVERLRDYFSKRNVTIGASGLAVIITANAVQAAPAGLATTISTAVLSGTVASTTTLGVATKTIAMTALQKTLVTVTIAALAAAGIHETRRAAQLAEQNQSLRQAQAPLAADLAKQQSDNARLSNLIADAQDQKKLTQAQLNELLKYRGQVGQEQTAVEQLAKLRAAAAAQAGTDPTASNVLAAMINSELQSPQKQAAVAKVARMKEKLHLSDAQVQAISEIMTKQIDAESQRITAALSKGENPSFQTAARNSIDDAAAAAIMAQLTPDQVAAYPEFEQAEDSRSADVSAKEDLLGMSKTIDLTQVQQDKIQAAFQQYYLSPQEQTFEVPATNWSEPDPFVMQTAMDRLALENKLKILQPILTSEQLTAYRQNALAEIDTKASTMKLLVPQKLLVPTIINGATSN